MMSAREANDQKLRVVDELRDFDVELAATTPTIDFPDAGSPEFHGWDRHDVHADLGTSWIDAAGVRRAKLLCSKKSGQLFVSTGIVRPLGERRPGERCLAPMRPARNGGAITSFWPAFVDLDRAIDVVPAWRTART